MDMLYSEISDSANHHFRLENENVLCLETSLSEKFLSKISQNYPLVAITQDSIDWTKIPGSVSKNVESLSDIQIINFIKTTTIVNYGYVAIIYSSKQPTYITDFDFFVDNLDLFISIIPHTGFFAGAQSQNKGFDVSIENFLEWELDEGMFLSGRENKI